MAASLAYFHEGDAGIVLEELMPFMSDSGTVVPYTVGLSRYLKFACEVVVTPLISALPTTVSIGHQAECRCHQCKNKSQRDCIEDIYCGLRRASGPLKEPRAFFMAWHTISHFLECGVKECLDTSPYIWDAMYQHWVITETKAMISCGVDKRLNNAAEKEEEYEILIPDGHKPELRDLHLVVAGDLLGFSQNFEKVLSILADFETQLEMKMASLNVDRALFSHPRSTKSFKILSNLLEFTRTESLRCIKKQKPWGGQKRSENQIDEMSRRTQATPGFGKTRCVWTDWERRAPVVYDELGELEKEARLRLVSCPKAKYREGIQFFLREVMDSSLGPSDTDEGQLFSDLMDTFQDSYCSPPALLTDIVRKVIHKPQPTAPSPEDERSEGEIYADIVLGVLQGRDIVDEFLRGPYNQNFLLFVKSLFEARYPGTGCHLDELLSDGPACTLEKPWRWFTRDGDECVEMNTQEWRTIYLAVHMKMGGDRAAQAAEDIRVAKRARNFAATGGKSLKEPVEDPLLLAIDLSTEKCPDCRKPLRTETMQIARSDEGHSVIGTCHRCHLFVEKGKVFR
jgi:hypothetical protein